MYDRICFLHDKKIIALYINLPDTLHEIPGLPQSLSGETFIDSFSMYLNTITGFDLLKQINPETLLAFRTGFGAEGSVFEDKDLEDDNMLLVVKYNDIKSFNDELGVHSFIMDNTDIRSKEDLVSIAEENNTIVFINGSYYTPVIYSMHSNKEIQNKMIEAK